MASIVTRSLQKTFSNPSDHSQDHTSSTWLLLALGLMLAVMQTTWRWPLGVPGHHGIEWMAFLLFGRLSASERWAASIVAVAAAGSHLGLNQVLAQAVDFKTPGLYLLTGAGVDLLHVFAAKRLAPVLFGALAGGLAFLCKPAVMLLSVQLFHAKAGMFRNGIGYPFLTHFVFGLVGGLGGALLWLSVQRFKKG